MTSLLQFRIKVQKIPSTTSVHSAHLMFDDHVLCTCLCAGSGIQNASQQFVPFFSTLRSASKPTNNTLQELDLGTQTAFISVTIQTWTHVHANFFFAQGPPPKILTFPPETLYIRGGTQK
jgi:hypothetical protein